MKLLMLTCAFLITLSSSANISREEIQHAINQAVIETDLIFSCSPEAVGDVEAFIQEMRELDEELESKYRALFNCSKQIEKAIEFGLNLDEITNIINEKSF
ncbi:hypothetical protein M899_1709 [Bacteriovorax sp. BSW11_IV]|uniref:hypothetical protein n=1 Tax=Bacteriovorax sp. BSW11_IV TaxID=1353529 RepID=UPI00038A2F3E|nr:hypothetical protein [Bacteriovorax sp. BSW11_IV]EQC49381.1 hypothetical protein M899_1709 [Bacteriovorax sp. BSW11_IV]